MKYYSPGRRSAACTLAILTLLVLLVSSVPAVAVRAQEGDAPAQLTCADVAPVGDVLIGRREQSDLSAKPGEVFSVTLDISNSFPYELRNIDVSAALFRAGSPVPQDWISVARDIKLAANAEMETMLEWNVPRNLPAGDYEMSVFAVQGSDADPVVDVVGRSFPKEIFSIQVTGDPVPSGYFDLDSLTVNGESAQLGTIHQFATDAEDLEVSVGLVNTFADAPLRGPLTFTIYEGFYPDPSKIVESESVEGRLISGIEFSKMLVTKAHFDRYLVTGQFLAEDGSRSTFMLPLERTDFATMMWPVPTVSHLGLVEVDQNALRFVGCLGHLENPFMPVGWVTPSRDVAYTLSVHRLLEGGAVADGEPIKTFTGTSSLGADDGTFGFTADVGDLPDQFAFRLALKQGGEVLDTREVRYLCDDTRTCAPQPAEDVQEPGSALSRFIESAEELIGDLRLFTWVVLLGVSMLFIFTLRPFLRRPKSQKGKSNLPNDPNTSGSNT